MAIDILDMNAKKVGEISVPSLETDKVNKAVLYYAVKAERNALRRGTAAAKDRSDVNKTNKKIYKQKGTGNARHASRKANIFVGGGSAHGPKPRSYSEKVNRKFKLVSYKEVLKYLAQNGGIKVLKDLSFDKPSTKKAVKVIDALGLKKVLVVLPQTNVAAVKSFRNIRNVEVVHDNNINVYDFLRFENLLTTAECFDKIKERYCV